MSLAEMIANSPIAAVISDPRQADNPIVECNAAFEALTGYSRPEIIGRNCRFLSGPETEAWLTEHLRSGIRRRQPVTAEILNYRKDRTPFRNAVMIVPIFDEDCVLEYFLGSQVEVSAITPDRRAAAYDKVQELTARQREILVGMADGKLNKQIAYDLGLSERTVKMHRAALFKALGVRTSADAIRVAIEAGY